MIGFDLETYPIGPKKAPKVVVGAIDLFKETATQFNVQRWATFVKDSKVDPRRSIYFFWKDCLEDFVSLCEAYEGEIVAHNAAYDWSCISAHDSKYIGRIYAMFSKRKLQCTYIRALITLNGYGQLKSHGSKKVALSHGRYTPMSLIGGLHFFANLDLSEVKDAEIQTTYSKVEGVPLAQWPSKYVTYLIQDVEYLHLLYNAQESLKYVKLTETYTKVNILREAPRRSAFHYALTLASAWGVRIDRVALTQLRTSAEVEVQRVADKLVSEGFAHELKGTQRDRAIEQGKLTIRIDNKAIQAELENAFTAQGKDVPVSEKGGVSTSRQVLKASDVPLLVEWADVGEKKTVWSTFIPALEKSFGSKNVINTSYFPYSETGRISARNPNLLNPPRSGGIRECVIAREGCCFVFCDYEANETRVLAQVLLDELKSSRLADLYKKDKFFDPHTYMACKRLKIPYSKGKQLNADRDKDFKFTRQLMKCCNFGFPGGMAAKTFIEFCKGYNVKVTEEEATELKTFFFSQFPEVKTYLNRVGVRVNRHGGQGYLRRAQRLSGKRRFCQLANFYFQGLAAEGGLTAFTQVSRAAYSNPESPLYGTRPVLFVHDEIILETPLHKAHDAALELKSIMEESMGIFTPDIPSVAEPTLAVKWWKGAYQKFDENSRLIPSDI